MSLKLGKTLDRRYDLRISFLNGFFNVGCFFNKNSSFVLFNLDSEFPTQHNNIKINMFKNLEASKFCDTFIDLHNYKNANLDIRNQFKNIKEDCEHDIGYIFNETINLSKIDLEDRSIYDFLTLYGLTMTDSINEFIFVIAERSYINKKLGKKIVRTTAVQIATTKSLDYMNDLNENTYKLYVDSLPKINPDGSIEE